MGERNFSIDLGDLFANIVDGSPCEIPEGRQQSCISQGKFFEGVHHFSHGPGGSLSAFGGLVRLWRACPPLAGLYASGGLLLLPGLSFQSLPEVFP